jgi:hypothetical protein
MNRGTQPATKASKVRRLVGVSPQTRGHTAALRMSSAKAFDECRSDRRGSGEDELEEEEEEEDDDDDDDDEDDKDNGNNDEDKDEEDFPAVPFCHHEDSDDAPLPSVSRRRRPRRRRALMWTTALGYWSSLSSSLRLQLAQPMAFRRSLAEK